MPRMGKKKQPPDYHKNRAIGFRLDAELVRKLRESAAKNDRKPTGELTHILKQYFAQQERQGK